VYKNSEISIYYLLLSCEDVEGKEQKGWSQLLGVKEKQFHSEKKENN
jgi:hypothetical protein